MARAKSGFIREQSAQNRRKDMYFPAVSPEDKHRPIFLHRVGREWRQPGMTAVWTHTDRVRLCVIQSGRGTISEHQTGITHQLRRGTIIIQTPGFDNTIVCDHDQPVVLDLIEIVGTDITTDTELRKLPLVMRPQRMQAIQAPLEELYLLGQQARPEVDEMGILLWPWLRAWLLSQVQPSNQSPDSNQAQRIHQFIYHARYEQLNAEALAQRCGMSRSGLHTHCQKHFGCSPDILRKRFLFAELADDIRAGKRLEAIAEEAGYASASAFSKAYKKVMGHSPSSEISG